MTRQEIREAAEWLKNWYSTAESGEYIFEKHIAVCNHALSTIAPDEDEPVTDEWLREEWGFAQANYSHAKHLIRDGFNGHLYCRANEWNYGRGLQDRWIATITTRSQFRCLMEGLNIKPRQPV